MRKIALLIVLMIGIQVIGYTQEKPFVPKRSLMIKTNLLNLLALRPTLTIEKPLSSHWSVGISYVNGQFNRVLLTDHYRYDGFTLDTKYYFNRLNYDSFSPYVSMYVGNLNRRLCSDAKTLDEPVGLFGVGARDFYGQSVRMGFNIGGQYLFTNRISLDGHVGLGYGKYYKQHNRVDPMAKSDGYIDANLWLSIGYCF
jgi:hypothetical protein